MGDFVGLSVGASVGDFVGEIKLGNQAKSSSEIVVSELLELRFVSARGFIL